MLFGVGVSCRIWYSIVSYLYVSYSESITSVGEERELICLLSFTCNYMVEVSSWCLGWAAYFIVTFPGPSI